jgi:hypothetical protein
VRKKEKRGFNGAKKGRKQMQIVFNLNSEETVFFYGPRGRLHFKQLSSRSSKFFGEGICRERERGRARKRDNREKEKRERERERAVKIKMHSTMGKILTHFSLSLSLSLYLSPHFLFPFLSSITLPKYVC